MSGPDSRPRPRPDFDCMGHTTTGEQYGSISAMWNAELSAPPSISGVKRACPVADDDQSWYTKSARYWEQQAPSVQGMLGGLGELDNRDVTASSKFLDALDRRHGTVVKKNALDVGAGIGRVTKHFLLPLFKTVDMLEQNLAYLEKSVAFIGQSKDCGVVDKRIASGMQSFRADGIVGEDGKATGSLQGRYNLVWIQWCIIYLTDDDLVTFLRECAKALAPGGTICLKDNVARHGFLVDKEDSSVMRSNRYLKHLFQKANLQVVRETKQLDFPRNIFPVRTYALQPSKDTNTAHNTKEMPTVLPEGR